MESVNPVQSPLKATEEVLVSRVEDGTEEELKQKFLNIFKEIAPDTYVKAQFITKFIRRDG